MKKTVSGFTIVELLIVIVVIAILTVISVVAYNGIQQRSQTAKIDADLATLTKAIQLARVNTNKPLKDITLSTGTAGACMTKPAGTDLAVLDKVSDTCWTTYATALQRISDASGMNIVALADPWGRPYVIDENEQENTATYGPCGLGKDVLAVYSRPLTGSWSYTNNRSLPYMTPGC